jgi:light-regulated signal transduction histidine kinase (bacteriophytochrome)
MTDEEFSTMSVFVHDARKPLNRISMQAELVKMALNGDIPSQKALEALDKIIASAKDCSNTLADMTLKMGESASDGSDD